MYRVSPCAIWLCTAVFLCIVAQGKDVRADQPGYPLTGTGQQEGHSEVTTSEEGGGSCGCENREDEFPPGAGFAFRREGYVVIKLAGGKVAKQRHFFEDERVTFKEVLSPGDGKTFPSNGQTAILRYTEFTSNECLPASDSKGYDLLDEDISHSVLQAVEGVDDMILRMSLGEKAMWFTSLDLGCVRVLQAWLQWWLEATCSEMTDAGARIFEVELVRLDGAVPPAENKVSARLGVLDWLTDAGLIE